ncbi:MAG TPA: ABC transporter permease [Chryseolinea sp.]|nr:ABC transporter permease [Chryseolinea sp.]
MLCLTVGMAFAMLIGIFIYGELEVNKSLNEVDELFLIQNKIQGETGGIEFFSPPLLSRMAAEQYPGKFADYYRFWDRSITISKGEKSFRIQGMIGDQSFLRIFGFEVLHGDKQTALSEPNSIIITEEAAKQYFDRTDVVNETLSVSTEQNGIKEYKITAVIAEPDDKNTVTDLMNMNAQVFISHLNVRDFFSDSDPDIWQGAIIAYVRLIPGTSKEEGEQMLNQILQKNAPKSVAEKRIADLSPLTDYYLITNHGAVMKLVISLGVIVIFILVLSITNFINISIGNSFVRLKEVGIRKVMGGLKRQLIFQFLIESIVLSILSGVLSLVVYQLLHTSFSSLLNASLPSITEFKPIFWISIVACTFLIGLLAGAYPSLFQAAGRPMDSLKGKSRAVQGTVSFSRVLMATQFIITTFIFIGAIVLSRQVNYFLSRDLGYNQSHVMIVNSVPRIWNEQGFQKMDAAKAEFQQSARIRSVTLSWGAPGWGIGGFENTIHKSGSSIESGVKIHITGADESYDEVYELKLLEGDFLFPDKGTWVTRNLVLNKSASDALRVNVGDKLKIEGSDGSDFTVAGIVDDFNYESMHEAVKPVIFMHNRDFTSYRFFSFRLEAGNPAASVEEVERLWKKVFPGEAFSYYFADERLQALYATELQLKKASSVASVLMLIIVMTGVLGLVSLNVSRRNKEIGIRKVLGATVTGLLMMFSKEYARLMIISFVVAFPLAYYFVNGWLANFVYHINLDWWMFALPGILLLFITVVIVSIQSYRTAAADPVKSLRHE